MKKLKKDEEAFEAKEIKNERNGCNCKAGCVQNYCECHEHGTFCDERCNCLDCKNFIKGTIDNEIQITKK